LTAPANAQRDSGFAQLSGAGVVVGTDVFRGASPTTEHRDEGGMLAHSRQRLRIGRQLELYFCGHDSVGSSGLGALVRLLGRAMAARKRSTLQVRLPCQRDVFQKMGQLGNE